MMKCIRRIFSVLLVMLVGSVVFTRTTHALDAGPNVLWITAEDMSPHLGCYGDQDAQTPRLDGFASQSVRYTQAFATAPVCSPARSCLITGMYATSLGTQRLRSQFPIPHAFGPFTGDLRRSGYYCSNNVKTDYNLRDEAEFVQAAWDDCSNSAHWRGRKEGQPFFAVFNLMTTHQSRSSAWSHEEFEREIGSKLASHQRHDPARMRLPAFYPDTSEARRAWARYHDCITLMDQQFGEILDQLAADGLSDDTVVFFFSDHGMGMPRGKRCLQDSGLHVPLLIHFPAKWQHLAPVGPGLSCDRLVSFVDFAPSVLSLCGVKLADHFQGRAFLGNDATTVNPYVYGARDRVDEAFDLSRSVRNQQWLYIRNFMPHLSWMQPEGYSDTSTYRQHLKGLVAKGKLTSDSLTYAAPRRALEELYDVKADPQQLHNLATETQFQDILVKMRSELHRWQISSRDLGFFTEPQIYALMKDHETPWSMRKDETRYPLVRILEVANTVGRSEAAPRQRIWLSDPHESLRYWAAVGLRAQETLAEGDREALRKAIQDSSAVVRIEAAAALAHHGEAASTLAVLVEALQDRSLEVVLHAARSLELLGPAASPARPAMQSAVAKAHELEKSGQPMAMFIRFSLEAALHNPIESQP